MPIITSLGRGIHQNKLGKGLYTSSDAQRGTTPTPSQAQRGLTSADPETRWFNLSFAQKQAWQAVAVPPMSGRLLFNTVNRIRPYSQLAPVADPPPGPYAPTLYPTSNPRCYADPHDGSGARFLLDVQLTFDPDEQFERFEFSYYKPRQPLSGVMIRAAQWYSCSADDAVPNPSNNLNMIYSTAFHGQGGSTRDRDTLPAGSAILIRLLPCTEEGYPGPPLFIQTTVLPPPSSQAF